MKKISILFSIFVALSILLTACGPAGDGAVSTEGTTVQFWHVYSDEPGEGLTALINEFNETNEYGITVEEFNQGSYSDIEDKVNAGIQSGDLPDVVLAYPNALADWYSVGSIVDLNQFINDEEYGLTEEELADIYPHLVDAAKAADGAWIAHPLTQSANVMVYNHTWAEELGFDSPPETSAELKEVICAATEANAEKGEDFAGTGGMVYSPGATNWLSFLYAFGGDELNDDETAYDFSKPAAIDTSMYILDLKESGCVFHIEGYPNPEQAQRRAIVTLSSTAGLKYYKSAFEDEGNDDVWGVLPFVGPDGNKAVDAYNQTLGVVPSTEEEELASWLFIKWLTSPEIQARWVQASGGYYGTQESTSELLSDYAAENPIWAMGAELASLGPSEPQTFPAWSGVRSAVDEAAAELYNAASEDEVVAILETLTTTANELVEEIQ